MAPCALRAAHGADAVSDVVLISPGENIQSIVDENSPGTSYLLVSDVRRMQRIEPKDGDSFTGEVGAVMSGAERIGPFVRRNGLWLAGAHRATARPTGNCARNQHGEKTDICTYLEDLFLDSKLLRRVSGPHELEPGAWFFDY